MRTFQTPPTRYLHNNKHTYSDSFNLLYETINNDYLCYIYRLRQKCQYMGVLEYKNALIRDLVPLVCVSCMISINSIGQCKDFFLMCNLLITHLRNLVIIWWAPSGIFCNNLYYITRLPQSYQSVPIMNAYSYVNLIF